MVSVLIFCHDKREGDFFGKLCRECLKLIEKESLYTLIMSNLDYTEKELKRINPPELIIVEVAGADDIERAKHMRALFINARLLLLSNLQVSPEYYVVPEISPDMLLMKPYGYLKAVQIVHKLLLSYYKDRERMQKEKKLLEIQAGGEVQYFNYEEIHYIEAREKKIVVHINESEFSFYNSLQKLEKYLPEYFIRCHRSYIVNFMFIKKVNLARGIFYLNEKTVIPISKKYKARLEKILQKYKDSEVNLG